MGGMAASDLCCNRGLIPSAGECAWPAALFRQRFAERSVAGFSHPRRSAQNTGRANGRQRPDRLISGVPACRSKAVNGKRWIVRVQTPHFPAPVRPRSLRPSFCCDKAKQAVHPAYPLKTDGYAPQPPDSAADRGCPPAVTQCPKPCRSDTASDNGPPGAAIRGCNPAPPPVHPRSKTTDAERCRSGRTGRSRKPLTLCGVPGFESLSLRQTSLIFQHNYPYFGLYPPKNPPSSKCLDAFEGSRAGAYCAQIVAPSVPPCAAF
jgi:hypothetical protein